MLGDAFNRRIRHQECRYSPTVPGIHGFRRPLDERFCDARLQREAVAGSRKVQRKQRRTKLRVNTIVAGLHAHRWTPKGYKWVIVFQWAKP